MQLNSKDKLKRANISQCENKKNCFKSIKLNRNLLSSWWSRHKLSSLPKKEIRNRCLSTQRGKAIKKAFKLSRMELKRWVVKRNLFGVQKASW
jgi:ribosomal protein S14